MIRYLTPEQVLFLHSRMIQVTGGAHGVRDLSMLLSAVARPQASFDGEDLYPDLFSRAAALLDSLIRNHPFVDGNKRTAITAAGLFLAINGWQLMVEEDELVRFTLACAQSQHTLDEIAAWLREHTRSVAP
ncbi:MAG: type II toxin-antitoxin system death-on-curing family toxin [Anaerolineaceae bacterium]